MKRYAALLPAAVLSAYLVWFCSCSVGPVTGTETGNPDISASLSTAFTLFKTTDRWIPSSYLQDGESILDPGRAVPSGVKIAKRRTISAGEQDTAGTVTIDSDMLILVDTVFVDDTIINKAVVFDTIEAPGPDMSGDASYTSQLVRYDTIFIIDTIVSKDTVYISNDPDRAVGGYTDDTTMVTADEIDVTTPTVLYSDDYTLVIDSVSGEVRWLLTETDSIDVASTTGAFPVTAIRSDSSYIAVTRSYFENGIRVSEKYVDGDGDGFLATSALAATARSLGTITLQTGPDETVYTVDFDAGADGIFTTTGDNRIYNMEKKTAASSIFTEQVRYGPYYFGVSPDTIVLQYEQNLSGTSGEVRTYRYLSEKGDDPVDHRQNRCIAAMQTIQYQSGKISRIEMKFIPDVPLSRGTDHGQGLLEMEINSGKGSSGVVNARIDFKNSSVAGTYAESGKEYSFSFLETTGSLEIQPAEKQ